MSSAPELKETVAQACRMLAMEGLIDYSGHISAREPGTDRVYIHSRFASRFEVTATDITLVDLEGRVLEGDEPPIETYLHTEVYRARPDIFSVAHLHPKMTTVMSLTAQPFLPVCVHGSIFGFDTPRYEDARHINTRERGAAVAHALGEHRALLLRGHGAVIAGEDVAAVFAAALHLEENAEKLYYASLLGEVRPLPPQEVTEIAAGWRRRTVDKLWGFYLAKAQRAGLLPGRETGLAPRPVRGSDLSGRG